MKIASTVSKAYFDRLKKYGNHPQIIAAATQLLTQLKTHGPLTKSGINFDLASKKDYADLAPLISFAYDSRYTGSRPPRSKTTDKFLKLQTSDHQHVTFVARHRDRNGHELILFTIRLTKDKLQLFDFFYFPDGRSWPHEKKGLTPYECERLAFHPYFDIFPDRALQFYLIQGIIKKALTTIEKNIWLGCIMKKEIRDFVTAAGIKTKKITGLKFAQNPITAYFQKIHPRYFQAIAAYEIILN